jgi:hypothetical protein
LDELLVAQDSLLLESDNLDRGDFDRCNELPLGITNLRLTAASSARLIAFSSRRLMS